MGSPFLPHPLGALLPAKNYRDAPWGRPRMCQHHLGWVESLLLLGLGIRKLTIATYLTLILNLAFTNENKSDRVL